MRLFANQDTYLKKQPVQSDSLPDGQKSLWLKGRLLIVKETEPAENGHILATLDHGAGDWYIWPAHWVGLQTEIVTRIQAETIFGNKIFDNELEDLNRCLSEFKINKRDRIRHFMAQIAHESGGLRWLKELADGWAYEGRVDLGNTHPGDGPRYKGAGAIQLTGRDNYQRFANYMDDPRIMEGCNYVAERYPMSSAGFFWHVNKLNELVDSGADIYAITRRINGGENGINDRIQYFQKACRVIN